MIVSIVSGFLIAVGFMFGYYMHEEKRDFDKNNKQWKYLRW